VRVTHKEHNPAMENEFFDSYESVIESYDLGDDYDTYDEDTDYQSRSDYYEQLSVRHYA
jgi:hypothetical protein